MSRVYVVRLIRDYSSDFPQLRGFAPLLCIWDYLGYTNSATGDGGSKAGTLFRSGENTGSSWECHGKARREWVAPARYRRAQDSSNNGNLRVQKVEFALQQETLTA
jgi:hypothetical protein